VLAGEGGGLTVPPYSCGGRQGQRQCFRQLLYDPIAGRVRRCIEMKDVKDATSMMLDDEEAIEHAERQRRHGEEVERCNQ
jgi:hypothetical protein